MRPRASTLHTRELHTQDSRAWLLWLWLPLWLWLLLWLLLLWWLLFHPPHSVPACTALRAPAACCHVLRPGSHRIRLAGAGDRRWGQVLRPQPTADTVHSSLQRSLAPWELGWGEAEATHTHLA